MSGFRDLNVWQKSKGLAVTIYRITQEGEFSRDFGFRDQIRRAAVSVPSNIAEGDERGTNKDAIRFFYISKGSLAELQTQLDGSTTSGTANLTETGRGQRGGRITEVGRIEHVEELTPELNPAFFRDWYRKVS